MGEKNRNNNKYLKHEMKKCLLSLVTYRKTFYQFIILVTRFWFFVFDFFKHHNMNLDDPFFEYKLETQYISQYENLTPPIQEQIHKLIQSYFHRYSLFQHQIDSFHVLMEDAIPQIIAENDTIEVISEKYKMKHVIRFTNVRVSKPMFKEHNGEVHPITPTDAMIRKLTYQSAILVDVVHDIYTMHIETVQPTTTTTAQLRSIVDSSDFTPKQQQPERIITFHHKEQRVSKQVTLFYMPVLVGSRYCNSYDQPSYTTCPYVPGGYFIVNGNEKVIVPREKLRANYPYIAPLDDKNQKFRCEVRSWNEDKIRSTSTLYLHLVCMRGGTLPSITVSVPFIYYNIPVPHIFRILGVEDPKEMRRYILLSSDPSQSHPYDYYIRSILKDEKTEFSREDLMNFIGQKGIHEVTRERRIRSIENIFYNEFLPHVGLGRDQDTMRNKTIYFGYVIYRMLRVYHGDEKPDDRDDYINKRLETVHMLCALQFRQLLRNFQKTFRISIHKAIENGKFVYAIDMMKNSKRITAGFKYALSTGKWGMSKGASTQTGVAQVLLRMTPLSTLCHLRRINMPINRDGKMTRPRQLHPSNWGILCSHESPEGAPCGLVKNLALLCYIRPGYSSRLMDNFLRQSTPGSFGFATLKNMSNWDLTRDKTWVFLNGRIVGVVFQSQAQKFIHWLRHQRRHQRIPFDTSLVYDQTNNKICILTDSGCCMRPVFVLENIHKFQDIYQTYAHNIDILWDMMLNHGVIEYMDKEEEFTYRIAVDWHDLKTPRPIEEMPFSHVEIHPSVLMGLAASIIPFSNHDQAPRVTYGSVMVKQGLGRVGLNYNRRYDTGGTHYLWYIQRPIVQTFLLETTKMHEIPFSANAIVAIASYTGFNQEDSIILNRGSVDRGLFRSFFYRTFRETAKNIGADKEILQKPDKKKVYGIKRANYTKLDPDDALVNIEETIQQGDILIGKVTQPKNSGERYKTSSLHCHHLNHHNQTTLSDSHNDDDDDHHVRHRDRSIMYKSHETAHVDDVNIHPNKDGATMINLRLRSMRVPCIGDKFSSFHGQKGVCSLLLPPEDMPFSKHGIVPDIIINPNAIPSRMTISQLMETVLGKSACMEGIIADGTPFQNIKVEDIGQKLSQWGFDPYGKEVMYNGITGEKMEAQIFIGPCPYMRLKHMVVDKIHGRRTGPRQILTHQPLEGRSREGGLRFGEMERDMLISHGAAAVLQDRLLFNSDYYEAMVCKKCGLLAQHMNIQPRVYEKVLGKKPQPYCSNCQSSEHLVLTAMPCAFKVLIQNLEACHVRMRLQVSEEP